MFREDIIWFIPAVLLALTQVKFIWRRLEVFNHEETELSGHYHHLDKLRIDYGIRCLCFVFLVQLAIPLFTLTDNPFFNLSLKFIGYIFIFLGFTISLMALKALGNNWTGMVDYRIKKGQQLVRGGIYRVIRHPIYMATILEVVGYELIANSWLSVIFGVALYIIVKRHILREEFLLEHKFGEKFTDYKKKTKMLIPYIL